MAALARVEAGLARIDYATCVGCGECYAQCPEHAVDIDWKTEIEPFTERMTEYALAVAHNKSGRIGYINFLLRITPDCDCLPWSDAPIVPDIGILASLDPVAIDQASLDLVNQQVGFPGTRLEARHARGEDKFKGVWENTCGEIQLVYGEGIGLGSTKYELVSI